MRRYADVSTVLFVFKALKGVGFVTEYITGETRARKPTDEPGSAGELQRKR